MQHNLDTVLRLLGPTLDHLLVKAELDARYEASIDDTAYCDEDRWVENRTKANFDTSVDNLAVKLLKLTTIGE